LKPSDAVPVALAMPSESFDFDPTAHESEPLVFSGGCSHPFNYVFGTKHRV
jgi:hypothetical protein